MWFKNIRAYQFTQAFQVPENLASLLNERAFRACGKAEASSIGWVAPVPGQDALFLQQQNYLLFCLQKEEKVLPASSIKSELDKYKEAYLQEHAHPMPKKEQQARKEDIIQQLLTRALSKYTKLWGMIDLTHQRVYVDTPTANKAEEFTALLRSSLGSFPVRPWGSENPANHFLTAWLQAGKAPNPFELGDDAELKNLQEEGMVVRFKRHDLTAPDVVEHLKHDKDVTELALIWPDRLLFAINQEYTVKRIRFSDIFMEQRETERPEDMAEQIDADFALLADTFATLFNALESIFELNPTQATD